MEVPLTPPQARRRPRAADLLPWADPYIAGLIRKLQDEVRAELADPPEDRRPAPGRAAGALESDGLCRLRPLPPEFEPQPGTDYWPRRGGNRRG